MNSFYPYLIIKIDNHKHEIILYINKRNSIKLLFLNTYTPITSALLKIMQASYAKQPGGLKMKSRPGGD